MRRSDILLIKDMIKCINRIFMYIDVDDKSSFYNDSKTNDAVIRNLELMGEAANRISQDLKEKFTKIPWKDMYLLRNRAIHEYFGIDNDIIWTIITENLKNDLIELKKVNEYLST